MPTGGLDVLDDPENYFCVEYCRRQGVCVGSVDDSDITVNWDAIAKDIQTRFSLKTPIDR